jgi:fructose-1,6-bisphosphatase I/sedoheptulose-1,7-bisphosphatase
MHRRLDDFLAQGLAGRTHGQELLALVMAIADAVRAISANSAKGRLVGQAGGPNIGPEALTSAALEHATTTFFDAVSGPGLAEVIFQARPDLTPGPPQRAPLLKTAITALEGSANFAFNATAGSIFGVWPSSPWPPAAANALPLDHNLIAAGYAIYGPATLLVLTIGDGTHGFTLDCESDKFLLTHPGLQIPDAADEFAIDVGRERFWESPVRRYITECKLGKADIRGRDFQLRWSASIVADLHRILMQGGVALYPRGQEDPGHRFLLTEAAPIAMLVEQAGGLATTCRQRIAQLPVRQTQELVPLIFGARSECERLERYHHEHDNGIEERYSSPLFKERSLFQ